MTNLQQNLKKDIKKLNKSEKYSSGTLDQISKESVHIL